jgi:hypothetical protein
MKRTGGAISNYDQIRTYVPYLLVRARPGGKPRDVCMCVRPAFDFGRADIEKLVKTSVVPVREKADRRLIEIADGIFEYLHHN